jgi:peptidoglycan/xylan/chitin deacetylase (PgdA/CDA1 family)
MNSKNFTFIFVLLSLYLTSAIPIESRLSKRSCSKTYKVQSGDSCFKIWTKYGLSESQFKSLNSGISCTNLKKGINICVGSSSISTSSSCKTYHTVVKGDNCYKIWTKYGLTESSLKKLNSNISCSILHVGDKICVKGSSGSSTTTGSTTSHNTVTEKPSSPSSTFKWYRECVNAKNYALTFDDGVYDYDEALLDLLKKEGIKATFFINGNNMSDITSSKVRNVIKRMYDEGHNVLSHTWSHKDLTTLDSSSFRSELKKLEDQIYSIIGKRPKTVRPPFMAGSNNENVVNLLKKNGYSYGILWYVDTEDWSNRGNVDIVLNFIKEGLKTSDRPIILNHSYYQYITKDKLLTLVKKEIEYLKGKGLKGVNMETCIGHTVYRYSGEVMN